MCTLEYRRDRPPDLSDNRPLDTRSVSSCCSSSKSSRGGNGRNALRRIRKKDVCESHEMSDDGSGFDGDYIPIPLPVIKDHSSKQSPRVETVSTSLVASFSGLCRRLDQQRFAEMSSDDLLAYVSDNDLDALRENLPDEFDAEDVAFSSGCELVGFGYYEPITYNRLAEGGIRAYSLFEGCGYKFGLFINGLGACISSYLTKSHLHELTSFLDRLSS